MLVSEYRRYKVNKAKAWRKNESNNEAPVYTLGEQANCASKEIQNEESSTSDADRSSTNILVETTRILKNTQYTDTMSVKNQGDQEYICQDWAEDGDKTLHPSKGPNVKSEKLKRLTRPLLKPFTAFGFSKSDKIRTSKAPAEAKERYSHEYDQSTNFGSDSQLVYSNRTDAICEKGDETNSYEYLVEKNLPSQKTHKSKKGVMKRVGLFLGNNTLSTSILRVKRYNIFIKKRQTDDSETQIQSKDFPIDFSSLDLGPYLDSDSELNINSKSNSGSDSDSDLSLDLNRYTGKIKRGYILKDPGLEESVISRSFLTTTLFAENPRPVSIDMGAIYNIQEKRTKHPRKSIHNIRDYQHT